MISSLAGNRAPRNNFFDLSSGLTPNLKAGQLKTKLSPCFPPLLCSACPAHDSRDKFITSIMPPEAGRQPAFATGAENRINQPGFLQNRKLKSLCLAASSETLSHPVPCEGTLGMAPVSLWMCRQGHQKAREGPPWLCFLRLGWLVIEDCSPSGSCVPQVSDFASLDSISESVD